MGVSTPYVTSLKTSIRLIHGWPSSPLALAHMIVLIFIILIFIMEKMCCVFLWIQFFAKCCCFPVTCGLWLIKHGCCTKIGRSCVSCKELVPDLDEKEKRAADTGLKWNGCDTTYLTTCCGAIKLPDDPERAQAWRLSTMISKVVPCVPASWSDVKRHGDFIGKKAYRELRSRAKSAQGGVRKRMGRDWRKDARLLRAGRYGAKEKQQSTDDEDDSQSEGVVDIDEKGRTKERSKSSKRRDNVV